MKLSELFSRINIEEKYDFNIEKISTNSKDTDENTFFVAIRGTFIDSHEEKYLMEAYNNGCRAFMVDRSVNLPDDAAIFEVQDTRKTLGLVASSFYQNPTKNVKVIGITGTKGKTSVSYIMKHLIEKYGYKAGVIGTSGADFGEYKEKLANTTPDAITLQRLFKKAVDLNLKYVILEVSSQAMKQFRVFGTRFLANVFTNISKDHIGPTEHKDFEEYFKWKKNILLLSKKVIGNNDDPSFDIMKESIKSPKINVGHKTTDDFVISDEQIFEDKTIFKLNNKEIHTNLMGSFNIMNLSLALATLNEVGFSLNTLITLTDNINIPGRMDVINKNNRKIIIDYAHNALSLQSILEEISKWPHNNLRILFGSVGGRTKERRKELPEVAKKLTHHIYLTSDNPDYEDPNLIIEEMASFLEFEVYKNPDRKLAIQKMIKDSSDNDILLITGKGDEEFQLINGIKEPYNDKKTVLEFLE